MAGSDDASDPDKLTGLIEKVGHDRGNEEEEEEEEALADDPRVRMDETGVEPEHCALEE